MNVIRGLYADVFPKCTRNIPFEIKQPIPSRQQPIQPYRAQQIISNKNIKYITFSHTINTFLMKP